MRDFDLILLGVVTALALGLCFLFAIVIGLKARKRAKTLNAIVIKIKQLRPQEQESQPVSNEIIKEVQDELAGTLYLPAQWKEFTEAFVRDDKRAAFNTMSADAFFKDDDYLRANQMVVGTYMPSTLTGIGMLGTFVGVTLALIHMNDAVDPALVSTKMNESVNPANIDAISKTLKSLGYAFFTSIVGLFFAIVTNIFFSNTEDRLLSSFANFKEALDRLFPRRTSEQLLQELHKQQKIALKAQMTSLDFLDKILETNEKTLEANEESRNQLQLISNDMADKIGAHFATVVQHSLQPNLERMTETVEKSLAQVTEQSIEGTKKFTEAMVQELTGALSSSFEEMRAHLEAFGGRFKEIAFELEQLTKNAVEAVIQQKNMFEAADAGIQRSQSAAAAIAEQLKDVHAFTVRLAELQEMLHRVQREIESVVNQQSHLQSLITDEVERASSELSSAGDAYAGNAEKLQIHLERMEVSTQSFSDGIHTLNQATTEASSGLKTSLELLQERMESEEGLLEDFGDAARGFENAFDKSLPIFKQMAYLSDALSGQEKQLGSVTDELKGISESMKSLGTELGNVHVDASQSLEESAEKMASVLTGTSSWAEQTGEALENFATLLNESLQGTMTTYDQSLGRSVNALSGFVHELEDVFEELSEYKKKEAASPSTAQPPKV